MAAALVQFRQGATTGTAGQAMLGSSGTSVQVQNGASNTGIVIWTFTVVSVPSASAVPLGVAQTGSTPTWNFTPDTAGCFIILLTTQDGTGATASDARAFGVLTTLGGSFLIPSFTGDNNSLNFGGQLTGWDLYMEAWLNLLLQIATGSFAVPIPPPSIVSVVTSGTRAVANQTHYYVNLGAAGGNVVLTTGALVAANGFKVKLIGSTGGFSCTINPIVAGSHIESRTSPGTLTTGFVMNALGDEVTLESPDGTNLYY